MTKLYLAVVRVPRWLMLLISGSVASFAINLFHGFGAKKAPAAKPQRPVTAGGAGAGAAPAPVAAAVAAPAPASPSKAKQRKGKGKK